MLLTFSETARASWQSGLFSFMSGLIDPSQASAESGTSSISEVSQQNYLQAPANPDPNPSSSVDIIPIANNTLFPDMAVANASTSGPVNTDIATYMVRPGDTVSTIADMFGISVQTIKQANGLSGSTIQPGQALIILPRSGIIYTVQKGDTLSGIAKKYGADQSDILSYNDMVSSSLLIPGVTIMIPDAEPLASDMVKSSGSSQESSSSSGSARYPRMMPNAFELELDNIDNWPSLSGYYSCPVAPGVGRLSQGLHSHDAVDLAAPLYTPLHAAHEGTIVIDRVNGAWNGGYGNFIVVSHPNGTQTLYAHMAAKSQGLVALGDKVTQGETIGYIGMTGLTTGPHVHFEVRGAQNPCLYYH